MQNRALKIETQFGCGLFIKRVATVSSALKLFLADWVKSMRLSFCCLFFLVLTQTSSAQFSSDRGVSINPVSGDLSALNFGPRFTGVGVGQTLNFPFGGSNPLPVDVTLRLTGDDGTGLNASGMLIAGGDSAIQVCAGTHICFWQFDTLNLNYAKGVEYTLEVTATDAAGSITTDLTFTYEYERVTLALNLQTHTTFFNAGIDGSQSIGFDVEFFSERRPELNVGQRTVNLYARYFADGAAPTLVKTVILDSNGQAQSSFRLPLPVAGAYEVYAEISGANERWVDTDSAIESVYGYGSSAGYAVILEGSSNSEEGQDSYRKTTSRIYDALLERQIAPADIVYLGPDPTLNGVDGLLTQSNFVNGLMQLSSLVNAAPAPIYFFLIDHGESVPDNGTDFLIGQDEITPNEFAQILDSFEASLSGLAALQPRIFINGFCYAEGFSNAIATSGLATPLPAPRIIISSAAEDEKSWRGLPESDAIRPGEFFVEEIVEHLRQGVNLREAFQNATEQTEQYTASLDSTFIDERFSDSSVQHPLLDDNGDAEASNQPPPIQTPLIDQNGNEVTDNLSAWLTTDVDGINAYFQYLGAGSSDAGDTAFQSESDGIEDVAPQSLSADADSAQLCVPVSVVNSEHIFLLEAWVREPGTVLAHSNLIGTFQSDYPMTYQFFPFTGNMLANGEYCFTIPLSAPGRYDVFYKLANVSEGRIYQSSQNAIVYKQAQGNTAPTEPTLLTPIDNQFAGLVGVLEWQASSDAQHALSYWLKVCENPALTQNCRVYADLVSAFKGITGLSASVEYFWQVTAVDEFGAMTSSSVRNFFAGGANAPTGLLEGFVQSRTNFANYIGGATVLGVRSTTSDDLGAYVLELDEGFATVIASKEGYEELEEPLPFVYIAENTSVFLDFALQEILPDTDGDGLSDNEDNCPLNANSGQEDINGDGEGDVCDDSDNDGLLDSVETNTGVFVDEGDTGSNPFDADSDGDGVNDGDEVNAGSDPNIPGGLPADLNVPLPPVTYLFMAILLTCVVRKQCRQRW